MPNIFRTPPGTQHAVDRRAPNNGDYKTKWHPSLLLRLRHRESGDLVVEYRFPPGVSRKTYGGSVRGGFQLTANGARLDRLPSGMGSGLDTFTIQGTMFIRVVKEKKGFFSWPTKFTDFGKTLVEVDGYATARAFRSMVSWYLDGGEGPAWSWNGARPMRPNELVMTLVDLDEPRSAEDDRLTELLIHPSSKPQFTQSKNQILYYNWSAQGVPYKLANFDDLSGLWKSSSKSFIQQAAAAIRTAQAWIAATTKFIRTAAGIVTEFVRAATELVLKATNALVNAMSAVLNAAADIAQAATGLVRAFTTIDDKFLAAARDARRRVEESWKELGESVGVLEDDISTARDDLVFNADPGIPVSRMAAHLAEAEGIHQEFEDLYYLAAQVLDQGTTPFDSLDTVGIDDTLESIAARNGVTVDQLIELNHLRPPYLATGRNRPLEEEGDSSVLYPDDFIKTNNNTTDTPDTTITSNDGKTISAHERLFRTDFEILDGAWVLESGRPRTISGPARIGNRIEQWDFVVTPGTSSSFPKMGNRLDPLVGAWADESALRRVGGLGIRQTMDSNPYVQHVRQVLFSVPQQGSALYDFTAVLIDGSQQELKAG